MQSGNDPFWFRDVTQEIQANRLFTLCVLVANSLTITQSSSEMRLASWSFQFEQARGFPAQT
jgi:hypothetical protein